jgi:phospholipid/cholesterol/gamma-HCH transport system substrate-binding protein
MKIKRELKVGVFAVLVIAVAWWGIKWLGGQNVLLTNNIYYVYYDDVSGLQESSEVKLRGVKVGNVTDIVLERDRVLVELAVETKYEDMIPSNSIAEMGAAGLMGGVEIVIKQGDSAEPIANDAFLEGRVKPDMIGMLADGGSALIEELNATVESLHTMLDGNSEAITSLVANLESVTATIDKVLASGQIQGALNNLSSFTDTLAENEARIDSMLANLDNFTGELAEADVVSKLTTTVESLNGVLAEINNQEGTVGKLLNDSELYDSLNTAGNNLGLLLEDLKANPMRYVHFSLFGTSEQKIAEKEAKREARRAKREATTESAE